MERQPITDGERIAARIEQSGDCWVWRGELVSGYYPVFASRTTQYSIIPTLWVQEFGPVPEGLVLTCIHERTVPPCVNPAHYKLVPNGTTRPKRCEWGHDLTDQMNIAWVGGRKVCLGCVQERGLAPKPPKRKRTP